MMTDYAAHLERILKSSLETSPRGLRTKEIIGATYRWDMASPLILDPVRKLNYGFNFGESAWILSGDNTLGGVSRYLKKWADYSDDGISLNGAYGPPFREQLPYVVQTLRDDNFSRQAVLTIWRQRPAKSKDIPCTVALQFFIREDKLHTVATMRSSDAWMGLPYDIFTFTMMSYLVAALMSETPDLVPELGTGVLNIGSAHLYEPHFAIAKQLVTHNSMVMPDHHLRPRALALEVPRAERTDAMVSNLRHLAEQAKGMKGDLQAIQTAMMGRLG